MTLEKQAGGPTDTLVRNRGAQRAGRNRTTQLVPGDVYSDAGAVECPARALRRRRSAVPIATPLAKCGFLDTRFAGAQNIDIAPQGREPSLACVLAPCDPL